MRPEIVHRCDLFYEVLSDFLDGELEDVDRAYVEEHLRLCPPCDVYLEQFRLVAESAEKLKLKQLPPSVQEILQSVLQQWKQQQGD